MKPSDMMADMLALLPAGVEPCILFKGLFLARMPAEKQEHLQLRVDELNRQQLAEQADALWVARNHHKPRILAAIPADKEADLEVSELTDTVAAVQLKKGSQKKPFKQVRTKDKAGGRRMDSKRDGPKDLCGRHQRFGGRAWECESPHTCLLANQTAGN